MPQIEELKSKAVWEKAVGEQMGQHWYAVRVRNQHEDLVSRHLRVRGLEVFLPVYRQRQRWSDRFKEIELPLFPGYVFCQFDPLNRLPVLTVPGVVHVVGTGKNPVPIDDVEIAAIRAAMKSGYGALPWPYLEVGQRVKIEQGPLSGVEGILLGFRGHERIILSITLLQRSVAVEIQGEWARPITSQYERSGKPARHQRFSHHPAVSHA